MSSEDSAIQSLVLFCRGGFEGECASEIIERAAEYGVYGYTRLEADSGVVEFVAPEPGAALKLIEKLPFWSLIFIRQWFAALPRFDDLDPHDRISPLMEAAAQLPRAGELVAAPADTTDGRELQGFCKKFASALSSRLRQNDLMDARKSRCDWRLHLLPLSGRSMWFGVAPVKNSSRYANGIQRLKFPASAPSRSTLKLEEAWHWFLPPDQRKKLLAEGMTAADLGAAPGGWTWQLVHKGMFVTAVDNGPMDADLMATDQVDHLREDAFTYQPPQTIDWMVCDIVDKPAKTTAMVIRWALGGWCRNTIFNLKLPMKQRYAESQKCLQRINEALSEANVRYRLQARQLYHDREEITCWLHLPDL